MRICVTQLRGIRYFTKFEEVSERDRLEVHVQLDDSQGRPNGKVLKLDLTSALLEAYAEHPEIGRVTPPSATDAVGPVPKIPAIRETRTVAPAYLSESKKEKDALIARVREAQEKVSAEKRQRRAELAAARAEQLVAARKVKAEKEEAEAKKSTRSKPGPAAKAPAKPKAAAKPSSKAKATAKGPAKSPKASKTPSRTDPAGLTAVQKQAVKKISATLAKQEAAKLQRGAAAPRNGKGSPKESPRADPPRTAAPKAAAKSAAPKDSKSIARAARSR